MNTASDAGLRAAALDAAESFLVEAPAGSGKTELLTQRLLKLLGLVDEPEQVIAITFTRKAAAEMRLRVAQTLRAAASAASVEPHREVSVALARVVLERSRQRGWSLIELGDRLQIQTIDALNAGLARRLPILTSGLAGVDVTDRADELYTTAARRTTDALGDQDAVGDALRQLLVTADNSLERLEHWLADILSQRDRWLRLQGPDRAPVTEAIESRLRRLVDAHTTALCELLGDAHRSALFALLDRLDVADAPDDEPAHWQLAAHLLLTGQGAWRRRFTRREGVPPGADDLRHDIIALRDQFEAIPGLCAALDALRRLPPASLSSTQAAAWRALTPLVPRLLAELKLVFSARNTVDHTELALGALQALGAVDAPSDLLLALDRRIEHILIDEFQDTSHLQWAILERLTAGWEHGDGRSLFLVGDPMQSIYRFRDADLSLFSKARLRGIGDVRLRHLRLLTNFRSTPELVNQINSAFASLFAEPSGLHSIQPPFRAAVAGRPAEPGAGMQRHWLPDASPASENQRVVQIARSELARSPQQSIGILVRSRSHLRGLRQALAEAGLSAHAVEIDSLADTALGQDLLAFTSALLHPADRLAWLGLLRGPCCGIGWHDLAALCGEDFAPALPELLADPVALQRMSAGGRERAAWLWRQLEAGAALRASSALGPWLQQCWQMIGGAGSDPADPDYPQVRSYFDQVDRLARHGDIDDPAELQQRFSRPDGNDTPRASGIELMTIHRAKGLEFDTVIVPGLSRLPRRNTHNLLFIRDMFLPSGEHLNLAAVHAEPEDALMGYLRHRDQEHEAAERIRLSYVAMTRARQHLHLVAGTDPDNAPPRSGSLLASLMPGLTDIAAMATVEPAAAPAAGPETPEFVVAPLRRRIRLPVGEPSASVPDRAQGSARRPDFEWVNPASIQVGTVIHRELHRLAQAAAVQGQPVAPEIDDSRYRRELALLGVESADLGEAAGRVTEALTNVWADQTGRWILFPHADARSEWRITVPSGGTLEHLRLDRSFVDTSGQRWIIDYKTGRHLGADVEAFLAAEVDRYRDQLERYAAAVAAFDDRPIRLGLYFPLLSRLQDWVPSTAPVIHSEPV